MKPTRLGKTVRIERRQQGMTLPHLAVKTGLSKGLLSGLENSVNPNPCLWTVVAIEISEEYCSIAARRLSQEVFAL